MARTLTATTAATRTLVEEAVVARAGLFPPFYPGPTAYPGRGTSLGASSVTSRTLTESAA